MARTQLAILDRAATIWTFLTRDARYIFTINTMDLRRTRDFFIPKSKFELASLVMFARVARSLHSLHSSRYARASLHSFWISLRSYLATLDL